MALPDADKAARLREALEIPRDEQGRPKRLRSFVTYQANPDSVVEVPYTTPGDVVAAEEKFGQGEKRFEEVAGFAGLKAWMAFRALCRHPQEHQRPTVPFEEWLEQVDQLYDEEPDVGPLAERLAEIFQPLPTSDG